MDCLREAEKGINQLEKKHTMCGQEESGRLTFGNWMRKEGGRLGEAWDLVYLVLRCCS